MNQVEVLPKAEYQRLRKIELVALDVLRWYRPGWGCVPALDELVAAVRPERRVVTRRRPGSEQRETYGDRRSILRPIRVDKTQIAYGRRIKARRRGAERRAAV